MKTCRVCKSKFEPFNSMAKACGVPCALELVRAGKEAKRKKETLEFKRKARETDKGWWVKAAQVEFNKWVRLRDATEPCISCQSYHQGQYHAGHYRSVGACKRLRFEPDNCHKQCAPCNNHKSGNAIEYRINLAKKIGLERVEWLEGQNEPKRYTIDELKQIRDHYRKLIKEAGE
jgi:hypothetical protein